MLESGYHSLENNSKIFEELSTIEILKLNEQQFQKIKEYAKKIISYHSNMKEAASSYWHYFSSNLGLQEKYHIASDYLTKRVNNIIYIKMIKTEFILDNDAEKSLLAVLICDEECKYYDIYNIKRKEGLSHEETLDYLQLCFGIKSPKLIQLERYYQLLNYRFSKDKVSIFDNSDNLLKR